MPVNGIGGLLLVSTIYFCTLLNVSKRNKPIVRPINQNSKQNYLLSRCLCDWELKMHTANCSLIYLLLPIASLSSVLPCSSPSLIQSANKFQTKVQRIVCETFRSSILCSIDFIQWNSLHLISCSNCHLPNFISMVILTGTCYCTSVAPSMVVFTLPGQLRQQFNRPKTQPIIICREKRCVLDSLIEPRIILHAILRAWHLSLTLIFQWICHLNRLKLFSSGLRSSVILQTASFQT